MGTLFVSYRHNFLVVVFFVAVFSSMILFVSCITASKINSFNFFFDIWPLKKRETVLQTVLLNCYLFP